MNELKTKSKVNPDNWNTRFVLDVGQVGTKSLPFISSKPYISQNGSVVKSVLKTKAKDIKRTKVQRELNQPISLEVISSPISSVLRRPVVKRTLPKEKRISALQEGKIKSLRNRARPFSLPMLRDAVQSPLLSGMEKSYSARDSTSRTSMLKIDVSLDMDTSQELKQWKEFQEITEDCDSHELGHLTKLHCIGKGSTAYVYKSVLLPSLQVVADKVVVVASQEKSSQIMRELHSLRALLDDGEGHPFCNNIVRLIEVYPNPRDGTISICLEYMNGGSLEDVVSSGGCQDEVVLAGIARQVIGGISYLHSHRHIHRDIKPGNILICGGNLLEGKAVVKISDFGIAKELEKGHSLADSFLGTFHYMSPERIAGKDYSFSSDIWGCGLTILAVAMGCYPFSKRLESNADAESLSLKAKLKRGGGGDVGGSKKPVEGKAELELSGGYWHILQVISQRPPIKRLLGTNHAFSSQFCRFLSMSLHRDKEERATANTLLGQSFLNGSAPRPRAGSAEGGAVTPAALDEGCHASTSSVELQSLREFSERCCSAQREKNSPNVNLTSRLLPTINSKLKDDIISSGVGELQLNNVGVILGPNRHGLGTIDPVCEYVPYSKSCAEHVSKFFQVLVAYKEFTLRKWNDERPDEAELALAGRRAPRTSALRHLLATTLAYPAAVSTKTSSLKSIRLASMSPSIAPLFDQVRIEHFSEQLHVPINVVVVCLRDFVLDLLRDEEFLCDSCGDVLIDLRREDSVTESAATTEDSELINRNDGHACDYEENLPGSAKMSMIRPPSAVQVCNGQGDGESAQSVPLVKHDNGMASILVSHHENCDLASDVGDNGMHVSLGGLKIGTDEFSPNNCGVLFEEVYEDDFDS